MILSRVLSIVFRFAQFVCAAVVLGLTAYFLHQRREHGQGPYARLVYSIVWSVISVIASLVLMIPFTSSIINYVFDFLVAAGWFAAFGLLVRWFNGTGCGSIWNWSGIQHGGYCNQWKAAQAFSFLSAIFWLASMLLGIMVYHRLSRSVVATDNAPRRRWGRRSHV